MTKGTTAQGKRQKKDQGDAGHQHSGLDPIILDILPGNIETV